MCKKFFACFLILLLVSCAVSAATIYTRTYERSVVIDDDKHVLDDYLPKTNAGTKIINSIFDPLLSVLGTAAGSQGYFEDIKKLADDGDPNYQFEVALVYETSQDYGKAIEYYHKADENFYDKWNQKPNKNLSKSLAKVRNNLGLLYLSGKGVQQDKARAFTLLLDASERGYAKAQYNLAHIYFDGVMGKTDVSEALYWYNRSADGNHVPAIMFLASLYENGYKVKKSPSDAFKLYRKAAELGYAPAQTIIGDMYYKGFGIKKNVPGAVKWYKKAAAWKYPEAQYKLANMYYKGEGVKKKHVSEAIKLWRESAKNGYEDSKKSLEEIGETL